MTFVELVLELSDCENIEKVNLPSDYEWAFTIMCTHCHYTHDKKIYLSLGNLVPGKNDRSEFHFYMKCKECKYDQSISILPKGSPYSVSVAGAAKAKGTLAKFECRHVEIKTWHMEDNIHATGYESSTVFEDIDLNDCWCDFDEKSNQNVMIE